MKGHQLETLQSRPSIFKRLHLSLLVHISDNCPSTTQLWTLLLCWIIFCCVVQQWFYCIINKCKPRCQEASSARAVCVKWHFHTCRGYTCGIQGDLTGSLGPCCISVSLWAVGLLITAQSNLSSVSRREKQLGFSFLKNNNHRDLIRSTEQFQLNQTLLSKRRELWREEFVVGWFSSLFFFLLAVVEGKIFWEELFSEGLRQKGFCISASFTLPSVFHIFSDTVACAMYLCSSALLLMHFSLQVSARHPFSIKYSKIKLLWSFLIKDSI